MTEANHELEGLRVLHVDDAADSRLFVSKSLERLGACVESAEDGLEGVTMAILQPYDVILMDLEMPILDGYSATSHLRKCGFEGPIFACSGSEPTRDVHGRMDHPDFDDLIPKPVDLSALVKRLRRYHLLKMAKRFAGLH